MEAGFKSINVLTRCEVSVRRAKNYSVQIHEAEEFARWIDWSVNDGELIISTAPMYYGFLLLRATFPKIEITCPSLELIRVKDKAYVNVSKGFHSERFGVVIERGVLDLAVSSVFLDCTVIKSAKMIVKGSAFSSRLLVQQRGQYDGSHLYCCEADVHLHEEASASVHADEVIDANLFGKSRLGFKGTSKVYLYNVEENCSIRRLRT